MFSILLSNPMLWANLFIPILIAIYMLIKKEGYILKEFLVQVTTTFIFLFIAYQIAFVTTTNLYNNTYYNTSIKSITYYEEWTEKVNYTEEVCSSNGKNCHTVHKTRYDFHPEYYELETNLGSTFNVNKQDFQNAKIKYGTNFKSITRFDKSSSGDGDSYITTFTDVVPYVEKKSEINYIKAVQYNVIKADTFPQQIESYKKSGQLKEYPETFEDVYGSQNINRIIKGNGVQLNTTDIDKELSIFASKYGEIKQVNPLIYIVKEQSREFTGVLKAYYENGAKNDAILIVSVDNNGTIKWSDTIAWTKNIDFLIDNTKIYKGMNINDINTIKLFEKQIITNFVRTPMKNYKFLEHNIDISLTAELIILILNIIISSMVFIYFLKNDIFGEERKKNFGY